MDQGTLVTQQLEDGKRLLQRLAEEGIAVTAACWVKESESGRWYLYIASPLVGEDGATKQAYRRILPLVRQMPQPFWVDPFDVKAVAPSAPLAEAVARLYKGYPGTGPLRYDDYRLGDVSVEGAYVYPLLPASVP
jgi:hypothetical protein